MMLLTLISPANDPSTKMPKPAPAPSWRSRSRALLRVVNASRSRVGSGCPTMRCGSHGTSQLSHRTRTSLYAGKSVGTKGRSITRRPNRRIMAAGRLPSGHLGDDPVEEVRFADRDVIGMQATQDGHQNAATSD